jgi:hypothetical protein
MIKKQIMAKIQSPILVVRDLIIIFLPHHIPRSPNFFAKILAATTNITHITDWKRPMAAERDNLKD